MIINAGPLVVDGDEVQHCTEIESNRELHGKLKPYRLGAINNN